jgi:hypothetical protein
MNLEEVQEKLKEAKMDNERTLQERIVYRFDASSDKALLLQDMLDLIEELRGDFPIIFQGPAAVGNDEKVSEDSCDGNQAAAWFRKNFGV